MKLALRSILAGLFFLLLCLVPLCAAAAPTSVIVDGAVKSEFKPTEVYFFVSLNDGPVILQQGLLLEDDTGGYRAGTVIKSNNAVTTVRYSLLAHGKTNQFWLSHFPEETLAADAPRLQSVSEVRHRVIQTKSELARWQEKIEDEAGGLRRLRTDAEVIGNLGRITRLMEQVNLLKEEKGRLTDDIERLRGFLKRASVQEPPKNFVRRQGELTSQLEELARTVKGVEEGEDVRRSLSEAELQSKLALIEETRLADADDLEAQLRTLRSARERLEGELGFDKGDSAENYLSW